MYVIRTVQYVAQAKYAPHFVDGYVCRVCPVNDRRQTVCNVDQPKMLSGMWKATTQLGASTISAIFKSPAVLQMQ